MDEELNKEIDYLNNLELEKLAHRNLECANELVNNTNSLYPVAQQLHIIDKILKCHGVTLFDYLEENF